MDHISQSPTHFSKVNLECVLQCTKFPQKKPMVICSRQTAHQLNNYIWNLVIVFKKRGENKHTCSMIDNYFLASSKQIKLCTRDYIFPIKKENIFDYNPLCFMSSGLMLDDIIMNIFTDIQKQTTKSYQKHFFPKSRMIQFTFTKDLCRILHRKEIMLI